MPLLGSSISFLLTLPILFISACECLYLVALFLPCWHYPSSPFQDVRASAWLVCFSPAVIVCCWHCLSSAIQRVSSSALLLCFSSANIPCLLLSRKWVSLLGCSVFPPLTLSTLCFSESEFLPYSSVSSCWHCLSSAIQKVNSSALLLCFSPADISCSLLLFFPCWYCLQSATLKVSAFAWLLCFSLLTLPVVLCSRMWVPLLACSVCPLLILPVVPCCPVGKWICLVSLFLLCWHCPVFCSRMWVPLLGCSVSSLLTLPVLCSRMWVPLLACSVCLLLTLPVVLCCPVGKWICLAALFLLCWHFPVFCSRMWVPLLGCSVFSLLTLLVLCSRMWVPLLACSVYPCWYLAYCSLLSSL